MPELPVAENRIVGRRTGEDLDDLTPAQVVAMTGLAQLTDANPYSNGPGIFAPGAATPTDGGWVSVDLGTRFGGSTDVVFGAGENGGPDVQVYVDEDLAYMTVASVDATYYVQVGFLDPATFGVKVHPKAGQTQPMLDMVDENGAAAFQVGPDGAIVTCNGVAVPITGVAVNLAQVHAALVALGLITT